MIARRARLYFAAILAVLGISLVAFMAPAQAMNDGRISGRGKLTAPSVVQAGRISTAPAGRISAAPASIVSPNYGTYGHCQNGLGSLARIGVYWQVNGFVVRPYQVWFDQAGRPIYRMEVKYYYGGALRAQHTFAQSGQRSQVHNWGGLGWGGRSHTTYVWFKLTASNGAVCTGIVGAAA
jgi:hypothetical protein